MDLPNENERLAIVCDLVDRRIAGEVTVGAGNRVSDLVNSSPPANEFISLTNVSVFDNDDRLVAHHRFMAVNKRYVRTIIEDERTPVLGRIKHLISIESYDQATDEIEYLMANFPRDAETYYLAGVVAAAQSDVEQARELFQKARGLAVEEKFQKMITGHLDELA